MKYIGEKAVKKLISLIKGDLAKKQDSITASGLLKGDGNGTVTAADTQEATLVYVPNGLLKGDGTTISQAVAGTDYMGSASNYASAAAGQVLTKTADGQEWKDAPKTVSASSKTPLMDGTAALGSDTGYAKGDHVHPTDTSRQAKVTVNGILKGDGNGGVSAAMRGSDYIASGNIVKQTLVASETTPTENYAINWVSG